jgi:hypothetical protein
VYTLQYIYSMDYALIGLSELEPVHSWRNGCTTQDMARAWLRALLEEHFYFNLLPDWSLPQLDRNSLPLDLVPDWLISGLFRQLQRPVHLAHEWVTARFDDGDLYLTYDFSPRDYSTT